MILSYLKRSFSCPHILVYKAALLICFRHSIFNCIYFCKVNVLNDVSQVIIGVMNMLHMRIPPFVRIDLFQIILTQALSLGNFS